jgi:riboflavin kinase/FMN adenylyltransferase
MRLIRGLPSFPPELAPSVVALGAFDGIHLAHAKILKTAVERARQLGVTSLVCTFDPNPASVLRPERAPVPLASLDDNLERIAAHGPDAALVIPFTAELSRMEAETFVDRVLRATLGAREVVVGFNHTFGRGAHGTAMLLKELGDRHGFTVHVLPPLEVSGQIVSSSAIREALRDGDVETARALLGHPYVVKGRVRRGAGRGRTLGFPTANLKPNDPLILAPGVYAAQATWDDKRGEAVVNVGYRPTFEEEQYWIEAFVFDFSGDLYDRDFSVAFLRRIRPEMKFAGIDALKAQVARDMETARRLLAEESGRGAPPSV